MNNFSKILAAVLALSFNGTIFAQNSALSALNPGGESFAPVPVSRTASLTSARSEADVPVHGAPAAMRADMIRYNNSAGVSKGLTFGSEDRVERVYRPFADYEHTGYLIMSSDFNFDSYQAKLEMARALPADGTLVIFTSNNDAATKESILSAYDTVIPRGRIKVVQLANSRSGFWARDGVPVPVLDAQNRLVVVDARYYHAFEPDSEIARLFGARMESHNYYYEGGNFMADRLGTCVMINHGAHTGIPDNVFRGQYGCERMIRLPFVDGIGHVDEHVRFVADNTVLTDIPSYKTTLEAQGLKVKLLPKPSGPYETYVNSVIMDGKAVVPVFNRPTDAEALAVYESVGFRAVGGNSRSLSNRGQGSVHCITMTYPAVSAPELMKALGATEL